MWACVIVWAIVASTSAYGIYVTKSEWCLLDLVLPLFLKYSMYTADSAKEDNGPNTETYDQDNKKEDE